MDIVTSITSLAIANSCTVVGIHTPYIDIVIGGIVRQWREGRRQRHAVCRLYLWLTLDSQAVPWYAMCHWIGLKCRREGCRWCEWPSCQWAVYLARWCTETLHHGERGGQLLATLDLIWCRSERHKKYTGHGPKANST